MSSTTKSYQESGTEGPTNLEISGPPGAFTAVLTAAAGVKYQQFKNQTQYVLIDNWGAGALKIGWNNQAGLGINADHAVDPEKGCYYQIPAGGVFAQPIQCGKLYFKAVANTEFSCGLTFSPELAGGEMLAADQFDMVEEMDTNRTNFT